MAALNKIPAVPRSSPAPWSIFSCGASNEFKMKKSNKEVKPKTKVAKPVSETKNAVSTRKKPLGIKKKDKSTGMMKKLIKETRENGVTQREKENVKKGKKLEAQKVGVIISKKLKGEVIKEEKKPKKEILKPAVTKKTAGRALKQEENLGASSGVPRASRSEVRSGKSRQSSKVVKKRAALADSSLPVKKKSKTSLGVKEEKMTKESEPEDVAERVGNLEMTEAHVEQCVQTVLKLTKKPKEGKKSLLPEEDNAIFLQVNCIKIPKMARRQLRVFLPHTMVGPTDEVALFVPDLERGRRKDYEKTVDHWETILRDKNVSQIREIIPMNKVKTEYSQYEMKLKLGRLFDFFLVDGRIAGHMTHLLGKTFRRSARPPTPVKLQRDNLKSEIDNALRKTSMEIHGAGNCHTMQVASATMDQRQIVENIIAACKVLEKEYPGGWENIRSILVKTTRSLGIPVYLSIKNKNKVRVTKVTAKRPKAFKAVVGELSTTVRNVLVKVQPGGKITLKKMKKPKSESPVADESQ